MAFIDDWQQKGLENWQANMEKFKLREQKNVAPLFRKSSIKDNKRYSRPAPNIIKEFKKKIFKKELKHLKLTCKNTELQALQKPLNPNKSFPGLKFKNKLKILIRKIVIKGNFFNPDDVR